MSKAQQAALTTLAWTGGAFLFASWLLSDPRCRRGCRTVAEHLREHALQEFIRALFV